MRRSSSRMKVVESRVCGKNEESVEVEGEKAHVTFG